MTSLSVGEGCGGGGGGGKGLGGRVGLCRGHNIDR